MTFVMIVQAVINFIFRNGTEGKSMKSPEICKRRAFKIKSISNLVHIRFLYAVKGIGIWQSKPNNVCMYAERRYSFQIVWAEHPPSGWADPDICLFYYYDS